MASKKDDLVAAWLAKAQNDFATAQRVIVTNEE